MLWLIDAPGDSAYISTRPPAAPPRVRHSQGLRVARTLIGASASGGLAG